jgi:ATP-dependent protease ClpP protease subunit
MLETQSNVALDEDFEKGIAVKFVQVTEFTEPSKKKFIEECDTVINSGQGFLVIVIDSYGGEVYAVSAMMDYLDGVSVPVYTVTDSKAMSCGAVLFSCGEKRIMSKKSTLMFHDMSWAGFGKDTDIQSDAKHSEILKKSINEAVDKNLGKKKGYLADKLFKMGNVDWYLTAAQAKKEGFATHIGNVKLVTSVSITHDVEIVH